MAASGLCISIPTNFHFSAKNVTWTPWGLCLRLFLLSFMENATHPKRILKAIFNFLGYSNLYIQQNNIQIAPKKVKEITISDKESERLR